MELEIDERMPINLDAEEPETLREMARSFRALSKHVEGFEFLAEYASKKARAMKLRMAGEIGKALALEAQLDSLYKKLPAWAKGW